MLDRQLLCYDEESCFDCETCEFLPMHYATPEEYAADICRREGIVCADLGQLIDELLASEAILIQHSLVGGVYIYETPDYATCDVLASWPAKW